MQAWDATELVAKYTGTPLNILIDQVSLLFVCMQEKIRKLKMSDDVEHS